MSGDVTPESLRALAGNVIPARNTLRAAADALEAAETKLARVREWFTDPMEDEALTWSRLEAILDDTEGDSR